MLPFAVSGGASMTDKIFYNARVYVEKGVYEEAVAIAGGRIQKVGKNDDILSLQSDGTELVDCGGKTLVPGFNDSHMHMFYMAEALTLVPLSGSKSVDELIDRCISFVQQNPRIRETGLFAAGWGIDELGVVPTRKDLDRISTDFPVLLGSNCGHYMSVNSKALEVAGINKDTPQLDGGEFEYDENGEPNGVFKALAQKLVECLQPRFGKEDYKVYLPEVQKTFLAQGITSVQSNDIGYSMENHEEAFNMLKEMEAEGTFKLRYRSQTSFKSVAQAEEFVSRSSHVTNDYEEDPNITFGGLKLLHDGSITGRSAMFSEGYVYDRENKGVVWHTLDYMKGILEIGKKYSVPVIAHAMGEQAIDETIALFEELDQTGSNPNRNALVHCEFTTGEAVKRIIGSNIPILAQPVNFDVYFPFIDEICDKDLQKTSFPFGTIARAGGHVAYGSDAPMIDTNPFHNIYAAVTRKGLTNPQFGEYYPDERIDRETAIDAYTIESAYVEFLEDRKGRIREGYYADMVLLSNDVFTCPEEEIPDIVSDMTVIKGEVVYTRQV